MKLKRISSSIMALAVSLSALSMPCTTAEVKDDDFWQKASNNYAYQDYVEKNDTFSVDVYNKIDKAMQQLWNYNGDITNYDETYKKYYYNTGIEYPASAKNKDEFYDEWSQFQSAVIDLYFMYRNDHPQTYFSPSVLVSGGASTDSSGNFKGHFNIDIVVDSEFKSAKSRADYKKMIYSYIDGANEAASIDSVYERTKYLHDYVCKDMNYAYDADGNPAHDYYTNNIIGAVDKSINSGVCECYSKTLELLLDYYSVENAFATGWGLGSGAGSGGPHAWNVVKFEDGQYYGVDATYDDGNREFSGQIFYDYFAKGIESDFDDTHIPDYDYSTKYLYQLPAYAETSFSPVKLSGASLSLTDGVKINFFADLNGVSVSDENYVKFTSEGGVNQKVKLADAEKVGNKYKFSVNLRPDQMTEKIKAQYIYSATGLGNTPVTYSAADYADSDKIPSSAQELVDTMMDYGAYAQLYTGKNIGTLDVTKYPDISVPADADFSGYSPINNDKSESVNVRSAALLIGSNTAIRVKFDISKFDSSKGMSFTCNGETLDYDVLDSNTVAVYVKGILPQQLDEFFEINAVFGSETIDFAYSPFSYMKYSFEKSDTDQNVKNLLTAMYNYNTAATEYLAKQ